LEIENCEVKSANLKVAITKREFNLEVQLL